MENPRFYLSPAAGEYTSISVFLYFFSANARWGSRVTAVAANNRPTFDRLCNSAGGRVAAGQSPAEYRQR
eukprot:10658050-Lingulodinium_polyedra.AAC.1